MNNPMEEDWHQVEKRKGRSQFYWTKTTKSKEPKRQGRKRQGAEIRTQQESNMLSQLADNEILHMNVEPNDITDEHIMEQPPPPRAKSTRWDKEHNNKT